MINDPSFVERAEIIREKGTDRSRFYRGQVDKYSWRDTGSSFGLSDTLAAYLLAQLEQAESIQARRRRVFEGYLDGSLAEGLKQRADELLDQHAAGLSAQEVALTAFLSRRLAEAISEPEKKLKT